MTERRHTRRRHRYAINVRENWYRDVWLLIITGVAVLAMWVNHNTLVQQTKGRHFAIGVTCAAVSSVSEAGRAVLAGSGQLPDRFERALERLGYPPVAVRRAEAQHAARVYVQGISRRIEREVGGRGARLVRADGTLDCVRLQQLSNSAVVH